MLTKTKYIPHLAEFYFKPSEDWSVIQAQRLFCRKTRNLDELLYQDKILYEDCIDGMKRFQDNMFRLIIADPPFGIQFDGRFGAYRRDRSLVIDGYEEIGGPIDTSNPDEIFWDTRKTQYDQFSDAWIEQVARVLSHWGSAYIISGWSNLSSILQALEKHNLQIINHIIWKYQFGVFTTRKFYTQHYSILFVAKNTDYYFNNITHYNGDVWEIPRKYAKGKEKNGTKLPELLVQKMIDFSSKPGDLILDPFMGNATTAKVARKNYRHYIGFEKNQKMKGLNNQQLDDIQVGSDYTPYTARLPTPEELGKQAGYQRAYKEYLRRMEENVTVE